MSRKVKTILRLGGLVLVAVGMMGNLPQVGAIALVAAGLAAFFFVGGGT